jgi:hypothetical protein
VTATPTADSTDATSPYIAIPADRVWFTHTKLTAKTVDGHDTLLQSVSVSYNDSTPQVIAAVGTGAVAGFAIGGPYGAVGGALISGVAAAAEANYETSLRFPPAQFNKLLKDQAIPTPQQEPFTNLICKADKVDPSTVNRPTLSLVLPVNVSLSDSENTDTDNRECWHLLGVHPPTSSKNAISPSGGNGWLYRMALGTQPFGAEDFQTYFNSANDASNPKHDFPYTACRDAELDLVWWQTAQLGMPNVGAQTKPTFEYKSYPLTVADPAIVQVAALPKTGAVTLGSVCGAAVSYTLYSGGTLGGDISTAVKDASDIKAAQDAYKKAQKGGS